MDTSFVKTTLALRILEKIVPSNPQEAQRRLEKLCDDDERVRHWLLRKLLGFLLQQCDEKAMQILSMLLRSLLVPMLEGDPCPTVVGEMLRETASVNREFLLSLWDLLKLSKKHRLVMALSLTHHPTQEIAGVGMQLLREILKDEDASAVVSELTSPTFHDIMHLERELEIDISSLRSQDDPESFEFPELPDVLDGPEDAFAAPTRLFEVLRDHGYTVCESPGKLESVVMSCGGLSPSALSESEVARAIGLMASTHARHLGEDGGWNLEAFVSAVKHLNPDLEWKCVIAALDYDGFRIKDQKGLGVIVSVVRKATDRAFPTEVLLRHWKHADAQLSFLRMAVQGPPDVFNFANASTRKLSHSENIAGGVFHQTWSSVDLVEILLSLAECGYGTVVRHILETPEKQCPDLLLCTLLASCTPVSNVVKSNLVIGLTTIFLEETKYSLFRELMKINLEDLVSIVSLVSNNKSELMLSILDMLVQFDALEEFLGSGSSLYTMRLASIAWKRDVFSVRMWLAGIISGSKEGRFQPLDKLVSRWGALFRTHASMSLPSEFALEFMDSLWQEYFDQLNLESAKHVRSFRHTLRYLKSRREFHYVYRILPEIFESKSADMIKTIADRIAENADGFEKDRLYFVFCEIFFDDIIFWERFRPEVLPRAAGFIGLLLQTGALSKDTTNLVLSALSTGLQDDKNVQTVWRVILLSAKERFREFKDFCKEIFEFETVQRDEHLLAVVRECVQPKEEEGQEEDVAERVSISASEDDAVLTREGGLTPAPSVPVPVSSVPLTGAVASSTPVGLKPGMMSKSAVPSFSFDAMWNMEPPPEEVVNKIQFIFNNLSMENVREKCDQLKKTLTPEAFEYFATYVVVKRAVKEPTFHGMYYRVLRRLGSAEIFNSVVRRTYQAVMIALVSVRPNASSSDTTLIGSLGSWLGTLTIAHGKPILKKDLPIKRIILEMVRTNRLDALLSFLGKLLEKSAQSEVFRLPNAWTTAHVSYLVTIYTTLECTLRQKFNVEIMLRNLGVKMEDFPKSERLYGELHKLQNPTIAGYATPPTASGAGVRRTGAGIVATSSGLSVPMTSGGERIIPSSGQHMTSGSSSGGGGMGRVVGGAGGVGMLKSAPAGTYPGQPQPTPTSQPPTLPPAPVTAASRSAKQDTPAPGITIRYPRDIPPIFPTRQSLDESISKAMNHVFHDKLPVLKTLGGIAMSTAKMLIWKDFVDVKDAKMLKDIGRRICSGVLRNFMIITLGNHVKQSFTHIFGGIIQRLDEMHDHRSFVEAVVSLNSDAIFDHMCKEVIMWAEVEISTFVDKVTTHGWANAEDGFPGQIPLASRKLPPSLAKLESEQTRVYDNFGVPQVWAGERITAAMERIHEFLASDAAKEQKMLPQNHPVFRIVQEIVCLIRDTPIPERDAIAFCRMIFSEVFERTLYVAVQIFFSILDGVCALFPRIPEQVTPWVCQTHGNVIFTKQITFSLLKSRVLSVPDFDAVLARSLMTPPPSSAYDFVFHLLKVYCIKDQAFSVSQFPNSMEALMRMDQKPEFAGVLRALVDEARAVELRSGKGAPSGSGPESEQQDLDVDLSKTPPPDPMLSAGGSLSQESPMMSSAPPSSSMAPPVAPSSGLSQDALVDAHLGASVVSSSVVHSSSPLPALPYVSLPREHEQGLIDLFREWLEVPDESSKVISFLTKLEKDGVLRRSTAFERLFRTFSELAVDSTESSLAKCAEAKDRERKPSEAEDHQECFRSMDRFTHLMFLIVRFFIRAERADAKVSLIRTITEVFGRVLLHDAELRSSPESPGGFLNQRAYFRFFFNMMIEVNRDSGLQAVLGENVASIANVLHKVCPSACPEFAFSWLQLVSHRMMMPRLLKLGKEVMAKELMMDVFRFLQPHLSDGVQFTSSLEMWYTGVLRILLVLVHDFPTFLCEYHFDFCNVIPPTCIQLRNLVLSSFPLHMKLPDPFTRNLCVNELPETQEPPVVKSEYLRVLQQDPSFFEATNAFLTAQAPAGFLEKAIAHLKRNPSSGSLTWDVELLNSLVMHCGVEGIRQLLSTHSSASDGKTESGSGDVRLSASPSMRVFLHLAVHMDPEGRYHLFNALANHLRYPNSHTQYFASVILFLFAEGSITEAPEVVQEH
eukprot:TRINITY_DN3269_c0_g1_i3.p1 TRINITY_DN3269_c0_g1~~TRINITY_DN3269_c0_g1_i3.p1  ORF type:complete len:2125 (+),score=516.92 TRINITY_DN3269_c0_g1_i3:232-6606(+)